MALLIAPLFTAGIAVGGIQNANAAAHPISCNFTAGSDSAIVTLSLGEESSNINKSIKCIESIYGDPEDITNVVLVGVQSCSDSVPTGTITPSLSSLNIPDDTATWIETITLNSDPGIASFGCAIEFDVDTIGENDITLLQRVVINFVPPSIPIGGTVGSMDTVSLLVAGAQGSMGWWIIGLVGAVAVVGIAYKAKSNKTDKETL